MIVRYWQQLNSREKKVLGGGGIFLSLVALYFFIWSPITQYTADAHNLLLEKIATKSWLQQALLSKNRTVRKNISQENLLTIVTEKLNAKNLQNHTYHIQQTSDGDLQLSFEKVPYSLFISWLWNLDKQYVIDIKQLEIQRLETNGLVKVYLVLGINHPHQY